MDRVLTSRINRRAGIAAALALLGLSSSGNFAGSAKKRCKTECGKDQWCDGNYCWCKEDFKQPCGKRCYFHDTQICVGRKITCDSYMIPCGNDCCDPEKRSCENGVCVCPTGLVACGRDCMDPATSICCDGGIETKGVGCTKCCGGRCIGEDRFCCGRYSGSCAVGSTCVADRWVDCVAPNQNYCGLGVFCGLGYQCCEIRDGRERTFVCRSLGETCR